MTMRSFTELRTSADRSAQTSHARRDPTDLDDLLAAARHYAHTYLRDEFADPDDCLDEDHFRAVQHLFDAIDRASTREEKRATA
jgi:hypothetical protein